MTHTDISRLIAAVDGYRLCVRAKARWHCGTILLVSPSRQHSYGAPIRLAAGGTLPAQRQRCVYFLPEEFQLRRGAWGAIAGNSRKWNRRFAPAVCARSTTQLRLPRLGEGTGLRRRLSAARIPSRKLRHLTASISRSRQDRSLACLGPMGQVSRRP